MYKKTFPYYKQPDRMDCGPTCLRMVAKYYGRNIRVQTLRKLCEINKDGVSLLGISDAAEKIGFRTVGAKLRSSDLLDIELPCILHWQQDHFVVLYKTKKDKFYIADPSKGLLVSNEKDFNRHWSGKGFDEGIALLMSPTPDFFDQEDENVAPVNFSFLFRYLTSYKKLIIQLLVGLLVGSLLQLVIPMLTQSIVDIGINTHNVNFIYIVLIAQSALIVGRVSVDFIRSWILLHISSRVNVSILTDFLIKLMKLPMSFFDSKMTGDIMQRMNDQKKIEAFLTGPTLGTLFSLINLVVFSIVLSFYNSTIFIVYSLSSLLYVAWIMAFLKRRRMLNYQSFDIASKNQSGIVQLVSGMQEIKLNNCEKQMRWEWEYIQARLFKFNVKTLKLTQFQQGGSTFINEGTNLAITAICATSVVSGQLTLGGMVAIQYIVGQMNNPIQQLLAFIQGLQDTKISLERLDEIHQMDDEEPATKEFKRHLPGNKSIIFDNLSFRYPGAGNNNVLKKFDLEVPEGKTTAIVGMSGSGKTTVLKLLLRFYEPQKGNISIGDQPLNSIAFKTWRSECGVVMQDGFIFSDTIARNIAVGDHYPDEEKLQHAIKVANLYDLIDKLPMGLDTKIGAEGNGVSQGQRQRILIARAVYKDPAYIFFDEATNSLDANNERVIIENLRQFFKGRTVIIVAHRLSTVSHADNIVVLDRGNIIEQGTHETLTALKGDYYRLVKNQLELGS